MNKGVIIYNAFLKKKSPGGQIIRPFLSELAKNKIQTQVVCEEDSSEKWTDNNVEVAQVPESKFIHNAMAVIRRLFSDLSFLPDTEFYSWAPEAKKKAVQLIDENRPDFIHSVSLANANHLIALELKKKYNLPWIVQFYDPWANNYFRPFKTKFFKKKDYALEAKVAENADIILHTNQAMCNDWINRYGDKVKYKMFVLPLSIPPQQPFEHRIYIKGDVLSISHIGNFYKGRTSTVFIKAAADFVKRYPEYRKSFIINYIGNVTEEDKNLISEYSLNDVFNLTGRISQDKCTHYYINTDIFLAVDGVGDDNLFFPSKIMKYFYYQKPILGITPSGSVLDEELKNYGCQSIDNYDNESIVRYLKNAIDNYKSLCGIDMDYWKRFTLEGIVTQYIKIQQFLKNK